jgi:hypothetical protein
MAASGATRFVDQAKLDRSLLLTQFVLLALSTARVRADWAHRLRTFDGRIGRSLLFFFAMSIFVEAIAWTSRSAPPAEEKLSSRSSGPTMRGGADVRAS